MDSKPKETALIRFCMICNSMFTVLFEIPDVPKYAIVKCPTCDYKFKATVLPNGVVCVEETMPKKIVSIIDKK